MSLPYSSLGIKLAYPVYRGLRAFVKADYQKSLGDGLEIIDRYVTPIDYNQDGSITDDDVRSFVSIKHLVVETRSLKPQMFQGGFGLSYWFGDTAKMPVTKETAEERVDRLSKAQKKINDDYSDGDGFGDIDTKDKQRKLVNTSPKNNSVFKNVEDLNTFNWELIGDKFENPNYIIEVVKIGRNRQPERTYIVKTNQQSITAASVFKDTRLIEGQYRWKVTDTNTGISSTPGFFSFSICEFNFSIADESIECLGYYEGADRTFKICFNSKYSSISGDLTYQLSNGLTVWDQNNNLLSYTLVNPTQALVPQVGALASIVKYCFEVIVSSSVTSIGFGLQGDDLDPSPTIVCQPGVSALFDDLPSCICDDCDDKDLTFDDFIPYYWINYMGGDDNLWSIEGSIGANVPIYGLEFQIQSYSYIATPGSCTPGVSNLAESGMFLMPGTTINGSASVQLFNETSSGSPYTNNNATKTIRYMSDSPLTEIPVKLVIGLPVPYMDIALDCCLIEYTVCIKVKMFYEEGNYKSCVFTKCFNFNNQGL